MRLSLARGCQQIINNHVKGELKFRSTISLCFCETFKITCYFILRHLPQLEGTHLQTLPISARMNGSGCRAPDSGDHRSGAYTGGPHHRMSGEGGAVGGAAQCTAPAGLIRETVTNVTAIDTWRPYHALHTARCPNNLQLSCGYPA